MFKNVLSKISRVSWICSIITALLFWSCNNEVVARQNFGTEKSDTVWQNSGRQPDDARRRHVSNSADNTSNSLSDLQMPSNPEIEKMFHRQANFGRSASQFAQRSPAYFSKEFRANRVRIPDRPGGFDTRGAEANRDVANSFTGRSARGFSSRAAGSERTSELASRRFITPAEPALAMNSARGFDREVPTREFRGRLPREAAQAMEELKMRQLTVEEVRELLNKHRTVQ